MTIQEWLDTPPPDEDIRIKDGGKYIPYHIIVDYLNFLTKGVWSTSNFSHLYYTLKNGKTIVSGSIDITIEYMVAELEATDADYYAYNQYKKITRKLSGAATFSLSKSSIPHTAASVKSLAVMNAVKPISKRFGWGLNGFETESVYFPDEDVPDVFSASPISKEENRLKLLLDDATSKDDLESYKIMVGSSTDYIKQYYLSKIDQYGLEQGKNKV